MRLIANFKSIKEYMLKPINFNLLSNTQKILFIIGFIGILSIIAFDKFILDSHPLREGLPDFSFGNIAHSILTFIFVVAIIWSLIGSSRPKLVLGNSNWLSLEPVSMLMAMFLSIITVLLFIFQSSTFSALSMEDNLIEWLSALLLFVSCFITLIAFFKNIRALKDFKLIRLSLVLLSVLFFVMAMEEVSWFQRVLDIETPEVFGGNLQQEMNLHNFGTKYVENMYYFGAFVFLVAFPFIRLFFPSISNNNYLKTFMPRPFIAVIGSIACAYNFDMWNIIFIQIAFFGALLILSVFAIFSSVRKERNIILLSIVLLITTQILFIVNGNNFERIWEVTEYKELFIPLAFVIYSLDMFIHMPKMFSTKKD